MWEEAACRLTCIRALRSLCAKACCWTGLLALLLTPAVRAGDPPRADATPPGDLSPVELAELPVLWQAQRSEIATAEIRFRCFNSSFENPQNTPEHVARLLAEHNLAEHPEQLEPFLEAFTARTFPERKPWDDMTLTLSGARRRLDGRFCRFVTDGDLEAVFTPVNRQLDLQPVGRSTVRHYRLDDLRWIPPSHVSTDAWQYAGLHDGAAVYDVPPALDGPDFKVVTSIDPASGLVTHSLTRHPDGAPAIEEYQSGLQLHASGILFPRLRVSLTYANGAVYTARIMLVREASFNTPIPDESFRLTAPAGTRVVDYRVPDKDVWIAAAGIDDALDLPVRPTAPLRPATAAISRRPETGRWWWLIAGVHLAGFTTAIALILHRRRSSVSRAPSTPH